MSPTECSDLFLGRALDRNRTNRGKRIRFLLHNSNFINNKKLDKFGILTSGASKDQKLSTGKEPIRGKDSALFYRKVILSGLIGKCSNNNKKLEKAAGTKSLNPFPEK